VSLGGIAPSSDNATTTTSTTTTITGETLENRLATSQAENAKLVTKMKDLVGKFKALQGHAKALQEENATLQAAKGGGGGKEEALRQQLADMMEEMEVMRVSKAQAQTVVGEMQGQIQALKRR